MGIHLGSTKLFTIIDSSGGRESKQDNVTIIDKEFRLFFARMH
jgi:hypothetical protein